MTAEGAREQVAHAMAGVSTLVRRLVALTVVLTYLLIALGGLVRVLGVAGCPGWPFCAEGFALPTTLGQWVKWLHWMTASLAGVLLVGTTAVAWAELTITHPVTRALALAVVILVAEAGIGGLASVAELPSGIVALHLGLSLIVLAQVEMAYAHTLRMPRRWRRARSARFIDLSLLALYVFLLSGALVTQARAAWACPEWPLCGDTWLPAGPPETWLNVGHRYLAAVVGLLFLETIRHVRRDQSIHPAARGWVYAAAALFGADVAVGAAHVLAKFPSWLSALHLIVGVLVWALLVRASTEAYAPGIPRPARSREARASRGGWRAYLGLTKPGIVALLVVSTLAGMIIAARGWPDTRLFLWTLIGSILSAGGANALNSYHDRDIDGLMARTARRPLPQGAVSPRAALIFGLSWVLGGILVMALFVNLTAALITALGAFWYSVVYTRWLKRRTVQNIVIGGAAGAFAPLVGWVAVTGKVDVLAIVLFLLIFMWTPPHTWAFALVVLKDYRRVGIPMLPVVHGIARTTREILVYTWLTVGVALAPAALGLLGTTYLAGALVLNAIFVYLAHRLHRHPDKGLANRLYQYSNAYLFLTFALMAFDRMGGLL